MWSVRNILINRRAIIALFALFFAWYAGSGAAYAEVSPDISAIEELLNTEVHTVTGASKYQQDLSNAPASVTIITADDIRKAGYRNIAEVISGVRGFYLTYDRAYHFAGVHGYSPLGDYNARILALVDGHRLNDGVYEEARLGTYFPLDIDLIDHVEVIRGPGSSFYGTNAFFAVINVVTRKGSSVNGVEAALSGGSLDSWTARATGGSRSLSGVDLIYSATFRDSAGNKKLSFPEYSSDNGGVAEGLDGERSADFFFKATWSNFSFLALHQVHKKDVPTAEYGAIFNREGENFADIASTLGFLYSSVGGFADCSARITFNRYEFLGDYPLDYEGLEVLNRDTSHAEWIGSDLMATKNLGLHLFTVGMEHRWQYRIDQENYDVTPIRETYLDDSHTTFVQGYYLHDEFHVHPSFSINFGGRFDHYSTFGSNFSPRVAGVWRPLKSSIFRLSYSEAFRAPNAYENYYATNSSVVGYEGSTDLSPERIFQTELSYDQYLGENLRLNLTGFHTHISNLLSQSFSEEENTWIFGNNDCYESNGVEFSSESKWESGLSLKGSITFQEATEDETGKWVTNSPRLVAKGLVTVPVWRRTFATMEAQYTGPRLNSDRERVGGATVLNLTLLNRDLVKGLTLSASAYNLFDETYAHPTSMNFFNSRGETLSSIEQDGLSFRVKAEYRF